MANIDQVQLPDGSQYHIIDDTSGYATTTYVQDQISTINKNTIGLGNVDNTADINKPVSLPQQTALNGKVDDDIVAYVESDTTATKRYEVGDQFILNGVLYTATAIIAVNDTIVIGTNCDSAEAVATQITENANAIVSLRSDITSINQTGTTNTTGSDIPARTFFYLNGTLVRALTKILDGATFTLGTNYYIPSAGAINTLQNVIDLKPTFSKSYSFDGTPDSNGTLITTVPRNGWVPVDVDSETLIRSGWIYQFYTDDQRSLWYWYVKITSPSGSSPSGSFKGNVVALQIKDFDA